MKSTIAACALVAVAASALLGPVVAQNLPAHAEWIRVADTETAFALWNEGEASHYAISFDAGRSIATTREADTHIRLRHDVFDPQIAVPIAPTALSARAHSQLHMVQYQTQGLEAYRVAIKALGAEVLQFLPSNGNLVRMDGATREAVAKLPFVRWVGRFDPWHRLERDTREGLVDGSLETKRYNIHVTRKGLVEKQILADFVRSVGGTPHDYLSPHGYLFEAVLAADQLLELAHRDEVLFIDPWTAPETDMDTGRALHGADYVEGIGGFSGQGVSFEVMDSGLRTSHNAFQANPPQIHNGNGASTSHGTSVYGQLFGDGTGNPGARGAIPDGNPIFSSYVNLGDRYIHTQELTQAPYFAVGQTNSWGGGRTFFYDNVSADMDNILFDLDFTILQSQSNAGNQDSRPQAWAKNIISIGGIRHFNTLSTADDSWTGGASIGPASDGRIKPDLSSFYDNIDTTSSASDTAYTTSFGGTSGATPMTAGHCGLFYQIWAAGAFGNCGGPDVFQARPHMTTAKAMMINFASQYSFSGAADDLTRVHQGWGRIDLQKLWDGRSRMQVYDESDVISNLQTMSYIVNVTAADPEFRATLVFADPAGNPAASVHRINDLTLRVTDPGGTVYFGNNGLLTNNYSTPGGVANTIDTVENVLIQNPTPGNWLVEVIAAELNQDGHVETAGIDADYALVIAGVDPLPQVGGDTGQPNSADASMVVDGALGLNGCFAAQGLNGPFFRTLGAGDTFRMSFGSAPNRPFVLLFGGLNRQNGMFGPIGSLDIGSMGGSGDYSDVDIMLNGISGTTFFDGLAQVGNDGTQVIQLTVPQLGLPPGVWGTVQALMMDPSNSSTARLSAAFEITMQ